MNTKVILVYLQYGTQLCISVSLEKMTFRFCYGLSQSLKLRWQRLHQKSNPWSKWKRSKCDVNSVGTECPFCHHCSVVLVRTLDSISQTSFHHNSSLMRQSHSFHYNSIFGYEVTTILCTGHYSQLLCHVHKIVGIGSLEFAWRQNYEVKWVPEDHCLILKFVYRWLSARLQYLHC